MTPSPFLKDVCIIKGMAKPEKPKKNEDDTTRLNPRKNSITCILTGKVFNYSKAKLEKEAKKLKFYTVEEYVEYYICKDARKLLKEGFKEGDIRKKYSCEISKYIPLNILKCYVKKFKNREKIERKQKKALIKDIIESNSRTIENYSINRDVKRDSYDLNKAEHVAILTRGACWRPDYYLDNDRTCVVCPLFKDCECRIKKMPKK